MSSAEKQALMERYEARFGNFDAIGHPSIITDSRFLQLLERALVTGQIVTRPAVEAVFPHVAGWDEVQA